MLKRIIGALRLDARVFEEIERDPEATNQAFMIVVLAGVAGGVGKLGEDAAGITAATTSQVGGWSLFALLAWLIGSRFFGTPTTSASWSELARTLGFAYTPMVLSVFAFIPTLGDVAVLAGIAWFAIAAVVAMRQALDFTTARAIATGAVCLAAYLAIAVAVAQILGTA